jgi:mbt repeat
VLIVVLGRRYVAKVVDIEGSDVLIHYVNWAARHDEWITTDSNRIRPMSGAHLPPPPPHAAAPLPPQPPTRKRGFVNFFNDVKKETADFYCFYRMSGHKKPVVKVEAAEAAVEHKEDDVIYEVDEDVRAIWTDSRKYPAKIVQVLDNGACFC